MNEASLNTRIDKDLKDRFIKVAKANDETAAQLVRKFVKEYLATHAQGSFKL